MPTSRHELRTWLATYPAAETAVGLAALILASVLVFFVTRRWLLRLIAHGIRRTRVRWDDVLLEKDVLRRASLLPPLLVVSYGLELVPHLSDAAVDLVQRITVAALLVVALMTVSGILTAANDVYRGLPMAATRPIKGYLQILKIFLFVVGAVLVVAIVLDRSPWAFVTGIGAMTAVILLIFRDTILSLVASVQLTTNDMVRIGDWIEMPGLGADGDVVDIALHTVKVQNWDKTITTIPTYKLIEESFKNWRGMTEAGGRRIKRALHIDMASVRFLDAEDMDRFERFVLLRDYIVRKRGELDAYNREHAEGPEVVANARKLTNLGTFRAYVKAYLAQRPDIHHQGMTFLVRQLPPGPGGLPLEIYVFARETAWVAYEGIQADIFDHLLAIVPEFGLAVFQSPSGRDLRSLRADESPPAAAKRPSGSR